MPKLEKYRVPQFSFNKMEHRHINMTVSEELFAKEMDWQRQTKIAASSVL
jgi:hypothetical protein